MLAHRDCSAACPAAADWAGKRRDHASGQDGEASEVVFMQEIQDQITSLRSMLSPFLRKKAEAASQEVMATEVNLSAGVRGGSGSGSRWRKLESAEADTPTNLQAAAIQSRRASDAAADGNTAELCALKRNAEDGRGRSRSGSIATADTEDSYQRPSHRDSLQLELLCFAAWSRRAVASLAEESAVALRMRQRRTLTQLQGRVVERLSRRRFRRDAARRLALRGALGRWLRARRPRFMLQDFQMAQSKRCLLTIFACWLKFLLCGSEQALHARGRLQVLRRRQALGWLRNCVAKARRQRECWGRACRWHDTLEKQRALQQLQISARSSARRRRAWTEAQRAIARHRRCAALRQLQRRHRSRRDVQALLALHELSSVRTKLPRQCFQAWWALCCRKRRHQAAVDTARIVVDFSFLKRGFAGWAHYLSVSRCGRQCLEALACRTGRSTLQVFFAAWCACTSWFRRSQKAAETLRNSQDRRDLAAALHALARRRAFRQSRRQRHDAVQQLLERGLLERSIRKWDIRSSALRSGVRRLRSVATSSCLATAGRCVQAWRAHSLAERRTRAVSVCVERRRTETALGVAWLRWEAYLRSRVLKNLQTAKISTGGLCHRQRVTFKRWLRSRKISTSRRATATATSEKIARSFFEWGRSVALGRRKAVFARGQIERRRAARCIDAARHLMAALTVGMEQLRRRLTLLLRWWNTITIERLVLAQEKRFHVQLRQDRHLVRLAFHTLRQELVERRLLRARQDRLRNLLQVLRGRLVHIALEAWATWTDRRLKHRPRQERWVAEKDVRLQGECFNHWQEFCSQRKIKLGVYAWCSEYSVQRLLRGACAAWRQQVQRSVAKHANISEWARTANERLQQRFLRAWFTESQEAPRRRSSGGARVAEQLLKLRRQRLLRAWKETCQLRAIMRQVWIVNSGCYQGAAFQAWAAWRQRRQVSRARDAAKVIAVQRLGRRRVLDRWCAARSNQRLKHLAAAWAAKAPPKRRPATWAFDAWCRRVAPRAAARTLGQHLTRRRQQHLLRRWTRAAGARKVRDGSLLREGFRQWRRCWRYAVGVRAVAFISDKTLLQACLWRLRAFAEDRRGMRHFVIKKREALQTQDCQRARKEGLKRWRAFAQGRRKRGPEVEAYVAQRRRRLALRAFSWMSDRLSKRKFVKGDVRTKAEQLAASSDMVQRRQRHWLQVWRLRRATLLADRFRRRRDLSVWRSVAEPPEDGEEIEGELFAVTCFSAWRRLAGLRGDTC
eukprot:TRINITY_DN22696_c0_g1_i2.p1 TRINITY_DN22696_c0_g1~~TRINITY_DN22696_c0_g1_i2.p1  ORF type:complete len:1248 (-),score=212.95 TRINITY_DN22696_c0_g1_i2:866-4609(-)